jgi:hypothetical protein
MYLVGLVYLLTRYDLDISKNSYSFCEGRSYHVTFATGFYLDWAKSKFLMPEIYLDGVALRAIEQEVRLSTPDTLNPLPFTVNLQHLNA